MTSRIETETLASRGSERTKLYLAGIHVTHSIAPPMHKYIASSLGLPNHTFTNTECPTVQSAIDLFRAPDFAGGVVTMPYKQAIMPLLDELDPLATILGACNNVYLTSEGRLRGTNTDWRGIKGCLLEGEHAAKKEGQGRGKPSLIIGAGGASRAAVYALYAELGCAEIYVVNRDEGEVAALLKDTQTYSSTTSASSSISNPSLPPTIIHITSLAQASVLFTPFYIVGTVPDFEAQTPSEILCRDILKSFLDREEKGVLLDMCFKPRNTRIMKMGRERGWECVDGTGVIGHQIEEQWRLWVGAGEGGRKEVPREEAWRILREAAESREPQVQPEVMLVKCPFCLLSSLNSEALNTKNPKNSATVKKRNETDRGGKEKGKLQKVMRELIPLILPSPGIDFPFPLT